MYHSTLCRSDCSPSHVTDCVRIQRYSTAIMVKCMWLYMLTYHYPKRSLRWKPLRKELGIYAYTSPRISAPSGSRLFFPGHWTLSAWLLSMLFSRSRLWRWIWVILFRYFAEGYTTLTVTQMWCLNLAHSTWVMDGWVCCAILLFASSPQKYQLIFQ